MRTKSARLHPRRAPARVGVAMWAAAALCLASAVLSSVVVGYAPAMAAPLNIACFSSDNGDPVLKALRFLPSRVDVRDGTRKVVVRVTIIDTGGPGAPTGIRKAELVWRLGGSYQYVTLHGDGDHDFVGVVRVPRWSQSGTMRLQSLSVTDRAGNRVWWWGRKLDRLGYPTTVEVVAPDDGSPPRLLALSVRQRFLDTRFRSKVLTVVARARDRGSGITSFRVYFNDERGIGAEITMERVAGTRNRYRGTTQVPQWIGNRIWTLELVSILDRAGLPAEYFKEELATLSAAASVRIVSRLDTTPPVLTSLDMSPTVVDVRAGGALVTIRAHWRDEQSGIWFVNGGLQGSGFGKSGKFWLTAGTHNDGTWTLQLHLRRCGPSTGLLKLGLSARDRRSNSRDYPSWALSAHGWPDGVQVEANDTTVPLAFWGASYTSVRVAFDEDVNGLSTRSAVLLKRFVNTPIPGTWTCFDAVDAPTACLDGKVRSAVFEYGSILAPGTYDLILNPEHQLAVTDLAGNPFDRTGFSFSVPG